MPEEKKGAEKVGKEKAGSLVLEASEGLLLPPLPRGLHLLRGGAKGSLSEGEAAKGSFSEGEAAKGSLSEGEAAKGSLSEA